MTFNPRPLFRAALLGASLYAPALAAQELTEELLAVDYTNCMTNCLDFSGRLQCEILCGCSMDRFRAELDVPAYASLSEQMAKDELTPESRAFLDETAVICVAEMDRLMEEMGLVMPPEAEEESPEG